MAERKKRNHELGTALINRIEIAVEAYCDALERSGSKKKLTVDDLRAITKKQSNGVDHAWSYTRKCVRGTARTTAQRAVLDMLKRRFEGED